MKQTYKVGDLIRGKYIKSVIYYLSKRKGSMYSAILLFCNNESLIGFEEELPIEYIREYYDKIQTWDDSSE